MNAPVHFKQQLAEELNARAASLSAPAGHRTLLHMPRRRVALTVGLAASAAVAVALPLMSGSHGAQQTASGPRSTAGTGAGEPAAPTSQGTPGTSGLNIVNADYAVKSKPGGMVSVQLFDTKGVPGLRAALAQAGIPATVMAPSASCHISSRTGDGPHSSLRKVAPESGFHSNGARDFKPSAIAPGDHLLFIADSKSGPVNLLAIRLVRGLPSCVTTG
ncbi:hypothetical protein [Streptomyces sp. NBC_00388]|uniref:hypothetical protein n=1 Tax=Streptomyces sp. NBC_00388 TaxID=2975735 RepID=UPI002E2318BA